MVNVVYHHYFISPKNIEIENRVNALKSESLDIDLLDEQTRRVLGYARNDETIYLDSNCEQVE